jgi:diguanylate cyclase (GGDEF)-like protein/PAS domain S-box-containing protein
MFVVYGGLGILGNVEDSGRLALTVVWLPMALGAAALVRWPRVWPGLLVGLVTAEFLLDVVAYAGSSAEVAAWVAANALAAVTGAAVLAVTGGARLTHPKDLAGVALAAVASALTFALVAGLVSETYWATVVSFLPGDTAGFIVAAPAVLVIGRPGRYSRRRVGLAVVAAGAVTAAALGAPLWPAGSVSPWQVLLVVVVLACTVAMGLGTAALVLPVLVLVGIGVTGAGLGPFVEGVDGPIDAGSILQTQLFVVATAITYFAAALVVDLSSDRASSESRARLLLATVVAGLPARVEIDEVQPTDAADNRTVETVRRPDGRVERVHRLTASDPQRGVRAAVTMAFDITEEQMRQDELRALFERSPVAMARIDHVGVVLATNQAFAALSGRGELEVRGRPLRELVVDEQGREIDFSSVWSPDQTRDVQLRAEGGELRWVAVSGKRFPATDRTAAFCLVAFDDVHERRIAEATQHYRATHDSLTGLLNRTAFLAELAEMLAGDRGALATLFCDVDGLKRINDTLGHAVGDELLVHVARAIQGAVPPEVVVSRFGGDEFVMLAPDCDRAEAERLADRIRDSLREPFSLEGFEIAQTISVGIAASSDASTAEELVRVADLAMYEAKHQGRDRHVHYHRDLSSRAGRALELESVLRSAVTKRQVRAWCQHIVGAIDRVVVGTEILARLDVADAVGPAEFIPVAETTGMMRAVSDAVLADALPAFAQYSGAGRLRISLNVSPVELSRRDYADWLLAQLHQHGVVPSSVVVEITESVALDASGPLKQTLYALRGEGVHLAIDDFGTGYSSLTALRDLTAAVVKLDRSFTAGLPHDRGSRAICRGVIGVAHDLGMTAVAEGVETEEQALCLAELGCDHLQGFLLHRPQPVVQAFSRMAPPLPEPGTAPIVARHPALPR